MSLGIFQPNRKTTRRGPRPAAGLGASTLPGICWNKPGFKECHAQKYAAAQRDCRQTGAVDFGGNQPKCIEVMTDAYAFNDCVPKLCPEYKFKSSPTQVGPIYAHGDPCDSTNTIKFVQTVVGTPADGKWGPASDAAYQRFKAQSGRDWYDIAEDCEGAGPYPREQVIVAPQPAEPAPAPKPELPIVPAPKRGVSKGAMLAGAGVAAVAVVGTYYYGEKKGWFK